MRRSRPHLLDWLLAAFMAVATVVYLALALDPSEPERAFAWAFAVLSAVATPCALWARTRVRTTGFVVVGILVLWAVLFWAALPVNTGVPPVLLLAPLVVYSWVRWLPSRASGRVALGAALAGSWVSPAMWVPTESGVQYHLGRVLVHWAVICCAYLLASRRRGIEEARQGELRALEARNEALLAERDRRETAAVQHERVLVSREIHDVLAHSLTLIHVQSTAGLVAGRSHPEAATQALEVVRGVATDALGNVRGIVGALRSEDGHLEPGPEGDLRDLPAAVDTFRQCGRSIHASLPGARELAAAQSTVPLQVRLATRRILQEALTNAVRHGEEHSNVGVELAVEDRAVRIVVTNEVAPVSRTADPPVRGGGYGLRGLAERAAGLGGFCTAAETGGVFRLSAVLPTEPRGPDPTEGAAR